MIISRRRKLVYLLLITVTLLAVGVFATKRPATTFKFETRQYPAGFRELNLSADTSRPAASFEPLVGLDSGTADQNPDPISDICKALFSDPADPTVGPAGAEVTIVEFFDYQCPYCRIVSDFIGKVQASDSRVRIVFKEWPILGSASALAARAALAAVQQGKYLRFHEALMTVRGIPNEALLRYAANKVGIDAERLLVELQSVKFDEVIRKNRQIAKQLGLKGTPSLVVGRTIVEGAITRNQLETLIDLEVGRPNISGC